MVCNRLWSGKKATEIGIVRKTSRRDLPGKKHLLCLRRCLVNPNSDVAIMTQIIFIVPQWIHFKCYKSILGEVGERRAWADLGYLRVSTWPWVFLWYRYVQFLGLEVHLSLRNERWTSPPPVKPLPNNRANWPHYNNNAIFFNSNWTSIFLSAFYSS